MLSEPSDGGAPISALEFWAIQLNAPRKNNRDVIHAKYFLDFNTTVALPIGLFITMPPFPADK
jgi:hypothetical protein